MEPKGFDSRTILVFAVCICIWMAWQQYLDKKYPEPQVKGGATSQTGVAPTTPTSPSTTEALAPQVTKSPKTITAPTTRKPESFYYFEDDRRKITVSTRGGKITEILLKNYTDQEGRPIYLIEKNEPGFMAAELVGNRLGSETADLDYDIINKTPDTVELRGKANDVVVTKTFTFVPSTFYIKTQVSISGAMSEVDRVNFGVSQPAPKDGDTSFFGSRKGSSLDIQEYYFNHGTSTDRPINTVKKPVSQRFDQTHFASLGSRYFAALLFNRSNIVPNAIADRQNDRSRLSLEYPVLDHGSALNLNIDFYGGPKLINELKKVDDQAAQIVDFGWFSWIALPLLDFMKVLYGLFKNYGVAIIALTIVVRILTFPFTYMSLKSAKGMQKIQPEMTRLREIYKGDNQKLQMETMKLMRENKVNPAGGCLPMLLQIPVFLALYRVLQNSIELYHSPFAFWIKDLSAKDPYYVLPVLMGATIFLQQKMTPTTMDPAQAKMLLFMPLMLSVFMLNLPSGLTLYMFVSSLFAIVQQLLMMQGRASAGSPALVRRT